VSRVIKAVSVFLGFIVLVIMMDFLLTYEGTYVPKLISGQWVKIECSGETIKIPDRTILIAEEENNIILPAEDHQKNGFIKSGMAIFFSEDKIIASGTILLYKIPDYEVVEKAELIRDYQERMDTTEVPTIYFVG
jgi:hypothetical protein